MASARRPNLFPQNATAGRKTDTFTHQERAYKTAVVTAGCGGRPLDTGLPVAHVARGRRFVSHVRIREGYKTLLTSSARVGDTLLARHDNALAVSGARGGIPRVRFRFPETLYCI